MTIDIWNPNREALLKKYIPSLYAARRIYSWTTESELAWLAEYSATKNHLIEIGSYVGKSAYVMFYSNPKLQITSFDTWDDENTREEIEFNLSYYGDRWMGVKGNSAETLKDFPFGEFYPDSAFVDGGHLYADVVSDIINLRRILPKGTVIAGHDYRSDLPEDGVTKAVRELLPDHENVIDSIWVATL